MIISHDWRFIFLKTKKTAGTSLELSLSSICGPLDVVTPVTPEDEALRSAGKPRNYVRGFDPVRRVRPDGLRIPDKARDFYNHMPCEKMLEYVGSRIWKRYLKVCFVRNPWDIEVSRHFFKMQGRNTSPEEYRRKVVENAPTILSDWDIIGVGNAVVADFVGRYETLESDFERLLGEIGYRGSMPALPRAKTSQRPPEARDYRTFYDDETRDIISRAWSREISAFGYGF